MPISLIMECCCSPRTALLFKKSLPPPPPPPPNSIYLHATSSSHYLLRRRLFKRSSKPPFIYRDRLTCAAAAAAASSGVSPSHDDDEIILNVGGMMCEGCASSVKRILESQPQVSSATVDLAAQIAVIHPHVSETTQLPPNHLLLLGQTLAKHLTNCGFPSSTLLQG
ncbi:copper-transporting ATPase PAA1, chloroplastic-like [Impatiens glandulifera]|uniref:copper-transporting ATPase PAA1, chloroplastic-like n=1 Tax=Impatiens glandulifera TaxID=253017 RepID=UPI001FB05BA6|nr:copper-transporting ATPase PAA1, chloroplastic-like [Impatiens glandulifera]